MREQDKVVGHAVRAMYMYAAMADLAAELGDDGAEARLRDAVEGRHGLARMYVTAGLGPAAANEGFTDDYDLPNDTAYAETCASVALIFWAQRMLHLDLDGRYADMLELALYNGALCGLSRDGEHYFYENPLESDGSHERWDWHTCPCCTMNVSRLVASVGGYFFSAGPDAVAFHLYGGVSATVDAGLGARSRCARPANYPWSGDIRIEVDAGSPCRRSRLHAARARLGARRRRRGQRRGGRRRGPATAMSTIDREWQSGGRRRRSTCRCRRSGSTPTRPSPRTSAASRSGAGRWSIASRRPTIPAGRCSACACPAAPRSAASAARISSTESSR